MADLELNLASGRACYGERYMAALNLYYMSGRRNITKGQYLSHNRRLGQTQTPAQLLTTLPQWIREVALRTRLPHNRILGATAFRLCYKAEHEDRRRLPRDEARVERIGSLAFEYPDARTINVRPVVADPPTQNKIGRLQALDGEPLYPVQFLPTTADERQTHLVTQALELEGPPTMGGRAFVALRGLELVVPIAILSGRNATKQV